MISSARTIRNGVFVNFVIDALKEQSDAEFQYRLWVVGSPSEILSLPETTASLYSDSSLDVAFEGNAIIFTQCIDGQLRGLENRLYRAIQDSQSRSIQYVLKSKEWQETQIMAHIIRDELLRFMSMKDANG